MTTNEAAPCPLKNPFDELDEKVKDYKGATNNNTNFQLLSEPSFSPQKDLINKRLSRLTLANLINESLDDLDETTPQLVDDDDDDLKALRINSPQKETASGISLEKTPVGISQTRKDNCVSRLNSIKREIIDNERSAQLNAISAQITEFMDKFQIDTSKTAQCLKSLMNILAGVEEVEQVAVVPSNHLQVPDCKSLDNLQETPFKTNRGSRSTGPRRLSLVCGSTNKSDQQPRPQITPGITKKRVSINPNTSTKENISPTKNTRPRRSLYLTPNRIKMNMKAVLPLAETVANATPVVPIVSTQTNIAQRTRRSTSVMPVKAIQHMLPPPTFNPPPQRRSVSLSRQDTYIHPPTQCRTQNLLSASMTQQATPKIPSRLSKIGTPIRFHAKK